MGEIGKGALADVSALAPALSKQDGGSGVSVGNDFDIHGNKDIMIIFVYQQRKSNYMGTNRKYISPPSI